jgi:putative ABC transport system permease protein
VDVAYVPLHTWQQIHAGAKPGEQVREQSYREASAVALRAQPGAKLDLTAGDAAADTTAMTRTASYDASPGYTAEMATMTMIKAFLYAISALVVGAFFLVWTIQRTGELAVLRAIGAPTRFLLVDGLTQAVVVLVGATAIGVLIAVGGSSFIHGMPFTLEPAAVATGAGLLVLLGVLGAAAAIVRVTRIDPLTALGANR